MRKIISILVAVGLVLAFSAVAMPTVGAACTATVTAVVPPFCAGGTDTYNITFTSPITLLPANDLLSVDFGAGTSLADVDAADVTVNGFVVASVVKTGTHIEFPVPVAAGTILAGSAVEVVIADVVNPAVPGPYQLDLDYKLSCCDAVVFGCADYTVVPAASTYGFFWDSGATYPGISPDFVPPFKACGQEDFPGYNISAGKWANLFDIILKPTLIGCAAPCADNVTITLNLTAAPAGSNVTVNFSGTVYNLLPLDEIVIGDFTLGANTTIVFNNAIHFDTVGTYQIYLEAVCPAGALVCPECSAAASIVAARAFDIKVHQWKDAAKITLDEKWNLISLPLVPLVDPPVEDTLASIPAADRANILSIWNYDRCADEWLVWGNGQSSLTELVDGDAYWVRVAYPLAGCGNITWWVWGTEKPMPPASPAEYPVCTGWNMFGFLSVADMTVDNYLWNFASLPVVYGWDHGCWTLQDWNLITTGTNLVVGQGYWGAFTADGAIYVP